MLIQCPHCRSPVELRAIPPTGQILCASCGSAFRLEAGSTSTWDGGSSRPALGRFELMAAVGHGAFGTVYRAYDPHLDRVVAVKVPRAGNLPEGPEFDRFLREARQRRAAPACGDRPRPRGRAGRRCPLHRERLRRGNHARRPADRRTPEPSRGRCDGRDGGRGPRIGPPPGRRPSRRQAVEHHAANRRLAGGSWISAWPSATRARSR